MRLVLVVQVRLEGSGGWGRKGEAQPCMLAALVREGG